MNFIKVMAFLLFCVGAEQTIAQNSDFKNVVSGSIGASAFGFASSDLGANAQPGEVQYKNGKYSNTATFQIAYDRSLVKWFSAGAALSYNGAKYAYDGLEYKGQKLGTVALNANRTTLGARLLFHYFNNANWDFYSGGRIGVGIWTGRLSLEVADGLEEELTAKIDENLKGIVPRFIRNRLVNNLGVRSGFVAPQVQFIPIGVRAHLNNNLGIGAELALGSPYYASFGINYRF
ncbi:MAG: hypothetical protein ACOYOA_10105 [Saprospiraceae bacterium]